VEDANVVVRFDPPIRTTESPSNPEPFTIKEKFDPPAATVVGEMEVVTGAACVGENGEPDGTTPAA